MTNEEINKIINGIDFARYATKRNVNDLVEKVKVGELEEGSLLKLLNEYLKVDIAYDNLIDIIKLQIFKK